MAKYDNRYIPKFVPNNLKWYERDGLETWYLQNKCNDFINNTDEHFKQMKIINFDIIKNNVSTEKLKQYQTLDHHKSMQYPPQLREQICSSIFRNANQKDMHIKKETMNILIIIIIKELVLSMDVLSKKLEMICMLNLGDFFFLFCILIVKEKKKNV